MSRRLVSLCAPLLLVSCGFEGQSAEEAPPAGDPPADPAPPTGNQPPAPRCKFQYADLCGVSPGAALTVSADKLLDTSVDASCPHIVSQGDGRPELCVIYASAITVEAQASLRATGDRVLVLATSGDLQVLGRIDVSSARRQSATAPERLGAAAHTGPCGTPDRLPDNDPGGGGGGAGASFGGKGGDGSTGDDNNSAGPDGRGDGGRPAAVIANDTITYLRGGCRGQLGGTGGDNINREPPGEGGPGGGAVYLAAAGQLTVAASAVVFAGGGGGAGGGAQAGGGGGGSGGMIALDAAAVHVLGALVANGGGGGEGGVYFVNVNQRVTGTPGQDSLPSALRAPGGDNVGIDGRGGEGSAGSDNPGRNGTTGAPSDEGGGGGGGGAGVIRVFGPRDGAGVLSRRRPDRPRGPHRAPPHHPSAAA